MNQPTDIGESMCLTDLMKYAERIVTEEGNTYFRFPNWFQQIPGDFRFIVHTELPEDLDKFITKAGLGGDNPQPKNLKL